MFKLDDIQFWGADDPLAALIICGASRADMVYVAGKIKVENGLLVGIDMAKLRQEQRKAQLALIKR